jgi:hypothetical protein
MLTEKRIFGPNVPALEAVGSSGLSGRFATSYGQSEAIFDETGHSTSLRRLFTKKRSR